MKASEKLLTKDSIHLNELTQWNVDQFDLYYHEQSQKGQVLYHRTLQSGMGAEVLIKKGESLTPVIMLGSNNYLGFANDPYIISKVVDSVQTWGCGVSGPPLLNGNTHLHETLTQRLAQLKNLEDCFLFPSGFQANLGLLDGLLKEGDVFLYDEYSHASLIDGLRLARSTRRFKALRFKHNQIFDLHRILHETRKTLKKDQIIYVAVEGVYSMDGDIAPLDEIYKICKMYDAQIILDDAHGTGILGTHGGGTCEFFGVEGKIPLVMGTFSKVFGMTGGFICGARKQINFMRFASRPYLFSAHLPITTIAAVHAGLDLFETEPARREKLFDNMRYFQSLLNQIGFNVTLQTPIIPIFIRPDLCLRKVNRRLYELGLFINAIEYPAVSLEQQRLRISLSSLHSKEDLEKTATILDTVSKQYGGLTC